MSVRPPFAAAILAGTKGWEFRRVRSRLRTGDRVFVYSTAPVRRVVGRFIIGNVRRGTPADLEALEPSLLFRSLVRAYLDGAVVATAIEVVDPVRMSPTHLSEMWPGMRAPQSYQYVRR